MQHAILLKIYLCTVLTELLDTSQCDEQKCHTLPRVHYTIFPQCKDGFIHKSTVPGSHSCSGKKLRVRLTYIFFSCYYDILITAMDEQHNFMKKNIYFPHSVTSKVVTAIY